MEIDAMDRIDAMDGNSPPAGAGAWLGLSLAIIYEVLNMSVSDGVESVIARGIIYPPNRAITEESIRGDKSMRILAKKCHKCTADTDTVLPV